MRPYYKSNMKDQILKTLKEMLLDSKPNQKISQNQIRITNEATLADYEKNYLRFRQEIDPRDKVIIHPFSFTIKNLPKISYSGQKFLESNQFKLIQKQLSQYLSSMCENVVSISFKQLNDGKLTDSETKDFASKNILSNVVAILTEIIKLVKMIVKKQDVQNTAFKLTLEIDDVLTQILKNIASYYPQAPPAGNTVRMREVIVNVNRSWDQTTDLIYTSGIKIDKYIRLKSWEGGQIMNEYEEYTGFIMEVINSAISVTRQNASERAEETVLDKFKQFNERLFCTSSHKHFKPLMNNILKKKNQIGNDDSVLINYYKNILAGQILDQQQNWAVQLSENIKDYFFNFIGSKKDIKQQSKEKKKLQTEEYLQWIKSEYDDDLQRIKKESKYAMAQKIPAYVRTFTKNDLKQNNFFVNSSAVLRVMTKWSQNLQGIFKQSEMIILQREYYFKNTKNQLIPPSEAIKNKLHQKLAVQYKVVKTQFQKLKEKNTLLKSYFMSQSSNESVNSFLKRYTQVRCVASQINASLIQSMRKYLCILIHHLLKAGSDIWTGSTKQNINLIVFRVNDLLRSKFQCNETTFINVLNTLYLLDKSNEMKDKFKLVRVKNKLDQKDNNILLNYMFLGKVQCQLQLSIQDMKTKEKNYYQFSHFVYELTRGKFGALTECAIIVSQHDPVVSSYTSGMYYKPMKYEKLQKYNIQEKDPIQFRKACKKDANLFVCSNCKKFIINDNIQLFKSKINVCNMCIMKTNNPQTLIQNQKICNYLCENINKNLKEVTQYSQIENNKYVITINPSGKNKDTIKLFKVWYHEREFRPFLIQINSFILSNTNYEKVLSHDFDYIDIKDNKQKMKKFEQLAYQCEESHLIAVAQLLDIDKQLLSKIERLVTQFQNFRIEQNIIKVIKFKNQIVDLGNDKLKLHIFHNVLENTKNKQKKDNIRLKKYRNIEFGNLKAINLNKLGLSKIPINFKDLSNLVRLNIEDNNLKNIDLTSIPFLNSIDISNNSLTQIQLQKNIFISSLDIGCNQLTSTILNKNINLTDLNLRKNALTGIDLSSNTMLMYLNLSKNKISKIDISRNSNLISLNLSNNELTTIDLTQNIKLAQLYLNNNKIDQINLEENAQLVDLNLFCNFLSRIDLSKNTSLTNISLYSNKLTKIDLTSNISLTSLALYKNQLIQINLTKNTQLTSLNLFGNQLTEVNLTGNAELTLLNLYNNQLESIDLSRNYHLVSLDLSYNRLKTINLTRNTALNTLDLRNNELIFTLDLTKNNRLGGFSLNNNKLSTVSFLFNTQLALTAIDMRNQSKEACDVQIVYNKTDQVKCKEFMKQISSVLYYKKYNFITVNKN